MKKMLMTGLLIILIGGLTSTASNAQDKDLMKRSIGPANFYLSMKDKVGISKEQEDKLITLEKDAMKKIEAISPNIANAQQSLNNITKDDEIDLHKTKELLKSIASLEADVKYVIIEAMALEKKVLTKEQRDKVNEIAREMSKGIQPPPPVKK